MKNVEHKILQYIESPEIFWSDDSVFSKRNISKINKHKQIVLDSGLTLSNYVRMIVPYLEKRKTNSRTGIYLQSCGGSGCHFIGSLLSSASNADMINEVYVPKAFAKEPCLVDFINVFHSSKKLAFQEDVILVNTAHLRRDFNPDVTKKINGDNLVLCLLRNPFDIVRSLVFRKQDYRNLTSPCEGDTSYFLGRCNHVLSFYNRIDSRYDDFVLYENFIFNPLSNLIALFKKHDVSFLLDEVINVVDANNSTKSPPKNSINFNSLKREPLADEFNIIYEETLLEVAREWGYTLND